MTIVLASCNSVKSQVLEDALKDTGRKVEALYISHKCGTWETPIGYSCALESSLCRHYAAVEDHPNARYSLAIESFVIPTSTESGEGTEWYSRAAVSLYSVEKLQNNLLTISEFPLIVRYTEAIKIPTDAVMHTINKEGSVRKNRLGHSLVELGYTTDTHDYHISLVGKPRYDFLYPVVRELVENYVEAKNS